MIHIVHIHMDNSRYQPRGPSTAPTEGSTRPWKDVAGLLRTREPGWKPPTAEDALKRRLGVSDGEYYYATGYALARLLDACSPSWKEALRGRDLLELAGLPAEAR
jgi:hypothetical protein